MKTLQLTLFGLLFVFLVSCKNSESYPIYTGEVRERTTDCNGLSGEAIIIKVYNSTQYDLVYTLTLPSQYWVIGKKISFKMRLFQNGDVPMICKTTVFGAKQVVVFDITDQEIN